MSTTTTGDSPATLSSRLRAGIECAPWVIEEVRKLESALSSRPVQGGEPADGFELWHLVYGALVQNGKPDTYGECEKAAKRIADMLQRRALSSAPAQPAREPMWQPIEAAPKDGRKLLLTYKNSAGLPRIVVGGWVTDEEAAETDEDGVGLEAGWYERIDNWGDYYQVSITEGEPTHWMPLPAAPGATAEPAPAREPMTEREILDLVPTLMPIGSDFELLWFARAIERHHGITKE